MPALVPDTVSEHPGRAGMRPGACVAEAWRVRHPALAVFVMLGAALAITLIALRGGSFDLFDRHRIGLIAWGILAVATFSGLSWRRAKLRGAWLLLAGIAGLAALSALALAWTTSAERTAEEVVRIVTFAGVVVLLLTIVDRRTWKPAATGFLVGGAAVCALAVAAALFPESFPTPSEGGRLLYPFGYANALAAWSAMTLTMALAWSVEQRHRQERAAALATVPLAGVVLYLTYSRAGLSLAVLGVLVVIALSSHRRRAVAHAIASALLTAVAATLVAALTDVQPTTGMGVVGVLVLAGAGVAAWRVAGWSSRGAYRDRQGNGIAAARWLPAAVIAAATVLVAAHAVLSSGDRAPLGGEPSERLLSLDSSRPVLWGSALDAFADRPVGGIGPGTYSFWWSENGNGEESVLNAHSLYLEQLAELGLPGLAAVLLLALGLLSAALIPLRAGDAGPEAVAMPAAAAVFVCFAAVDWLWESTAVTILALACSAVAVHGASRRSRQHRVRTAASPGFRRVAGRAALVTVAVAAVALHVPGMLAESGVRDAGSALAAGSLDRAVTRADDAMDAAPWAAAPYAQRALARLAQEAPRLALLDAREAIAREERNWRHWLLSARAQRRLGNFRAAGAAYRRAGKLGYPIAAGAQRTLP